MRLRRCLLASFVPLLTMAPWACGGGDSNDLPGFDASTLEGGGDGSIARTDSGTGEGGTPSCVRVTSQGAQKLMDLAIVTDNSGSLGQVAADAGVPWSVVRNQFIERIVKAAPAVGIRASMTTFPKGAACDVPTYAAPYVKATDLPTNAFTAPLGALTPTAASYVYEGLLGGYAIATALHTATMHDLTRVLLVTDGSPIGCLADGGSGTPAETLSAAAAALNAGVPTYVGYLPSTAGQDVWANQLATAGGTQAATVIEPAKVDALADTMLAALRAGMGDPVSCSLPAPSDLGDGGPPMAPTRLTIFVTPEGGTRAEVPYLASCAPPDAGPPKEAGADAGDAAALDAGSSGPPVGWTMIAGKVTLCPASCDPLQRERTARVEIGVDCN